MDKLDEDLRQLTRHIPPANKEANWRAIHEKLKHPVAETIKFTQLKTAVFAGLLLIGFNISFWIWGSSKGTSGIPPVHSEPYLQTYDFNLYQ